MYNSEGAEKLLDWWSEDMKLCQWCVEIDLKTQTWENQILCCLLAIDIWGWQSTGMRDTDTFLRISVSLMGEKFIMFHFVQGTTVSNVHKHLNFSPEDELQQWWREISAPFLHAKSQLPTRLAAIWLLLTTTNILSLFFFFFKDTDK